MAASPARAARPRVPLGSGPAARAGLPGRAVVRGPAVVDRAGPGRLVARLVDRFPGRATAPPVSSAVRWPRVYPARASMARTPSVRATVHPPRTAEAAPRDTARVARSGATVT